MPLAPQALPSWADLDTDEIEVKDVSGHGGSKTFKVTAPDGTDPPADYTEEDFDKELLEMDAMLATS